jgi:hypothetical protein
MVRIAGSDPVDTIRMIEVINYITKGKQLAGEDGVVRL